jgi:3-oxoacyl-[acyl-carrier protein] reductase
MAAESSSAHRFAGQSAIVTGGASGIGLKVVETLVAEGATVAIWDSAGEAAAACAKRIGPAVKAFPVDVSQWESLASALPPTLAFLHGRIDVLITSAGITGPNKTLADYAPEDWRRVFDINTHGAFYCNKLVVPVMVQQNYGRIVNVASVAGKEGNPTASAYSASKAAVIGFTKSLGKELAKTGVTANCVTPAAVRTPIFDQMSQTHIDYMLSKIPMGRFGETQEVTAAILWLASREASFTTASVVDVTGGRSTY